MMEKQNLLRSSQTNTDDESFPPEDVDPDNLIEPPPLDWRSDSSSEACSLRDEAGLFCTDVEEFFDGGDQNRSFSSQTDDLRVKERNIVGVQENHLETMNNNPEEGVRTQDVDHSHIQTLLDQLQLLYPQNAPKETEPSCLVSAERSTVSGLLFTESHQKDLLQLLEEPEPQQTPNKRPTQTTECSSGQVSQVTDGHREAHLSQAAEEVSGLYDSGTWHFKDEDFGMMLNYSANQISDWVKESKAVSGDEQGSHSAQEETEPTSKPSFKNVPGPCDAEDLLDGIIFGAKYLGSTQLQSERNPSTNARMAQAQEAVDRIKAPEGESQPMTEVDLFISTQRIKVLNAVTQEAMMDHSLQMISYIADIGNVLVLMVRKKTAGHNNTDSASTPSSTPKKCWMICHVFSSVDAHVIAQAIGQAFGVAYQQFLQENGIDAKELRPGEYCLSTQELYNGDLVHFSQSENIKEVCISKPVGEILGIAIVESGWGSILPTVVVANLLHGGAAERSGELSIGDRIMSVNGASLVGLSITACHDIIRDLKGHSRVKLSIVHCPPVTMAIIKRPDPKYQLGFSVEDGIICSLMRGGIAERGGIRVGHRIIEVNGQSVVATPHEKIVQILTDAVGEIHLKTMPVSTYRLLTGQDQPVYL